MSRVARRVGVRELRQNLSVHLRAVADGHTLEVTEHGRPVALLAPLPQPASTVARLVATGRATRPEGDLVELGPPKGRPSRRLTRALRSLRADHR
ncbi:MAG: type II toxin-antitoxin system prevent-host-death family antitoxin [Deltaproteobacteria bacterium]|nr:type II toxin-antitoxin system prevent-host-death family antitoxin [Deltaproteobacteria bacterium]